ncbi:hypothetical protein [Ferrimonas marina]|uniref:Uncharacterized protein n=1 Tax=Ferrimonas marina TaxID=299255 RepID=A0A1M5TKP4_9GAMM|nr:hypothetical protein [Ferrimonas marina]SHH51274.1 hypothetical protein SAMN02745129_2182 [Ferrimonas marina]
MEELIIKGLALGALAQLLVMATYQNSRFTAAGTVLSLLVLALATGQCTTIEALVTAGGMVCGTITCEQVSRIARQLWASENHQDASPG